MIGMRYIENYCNQDDFNINWFEKQSFGDELPSAKWHNGCSNKNDEICRDKEFDNLYWWVDADNKKAAEEYRNMIGEFRKRHGMEEKA